MSRTQWWHTSWRHCTPDVIIKQLIWQFFMFFDLFQFKTKIFVRKTLQTWHALTLKSWLLSEQRTDACALRRNVFRMPVAWSAVNLTWRQSRRSNAKAGCRASFRCQIIFTRSRSTHVQATTRHTYSYATAVKQVRSKQHKTRHVHIRPSKAISIDFSFVV